MIKMKKNQYGTVTVKRLIYYSRFRDQGENSCASSAIAGGEQETAAQGLTLIPLGKILA